ncbi:hypothetical protein ABT084_18330 [Streptomyces sp. NPDC002138]|uniref:hypothetical protein n=1 Tax=Streptomyces sp. NPDC002138 TaxID=3154410 RepID=UPI00332A3F0E
MTAPEAGTGPAGTGPADMVGIVLVSHSAAVAESVAELAQGLAAGGPVAPVAASLFPLPSSLGRGRRHGGGAPDQSVMER